MLVLGFFLQMSVWGLGEEVCVLLLVSARLTLFPPCPQGEVPFVVDPIG